MSDGTGVILLFAWAVLTAFACGLGLATGIYWLGVGLAGIVLMGIIVACAWRSR